MADILSILSNQDNNQMDPDGRLVSLPVWSDAIATDLAKDYGLELGTQHLEVLHQLRNYYCKQDNWSHPRDTLKIMEHACAKIIGTENSRKELYQLFPHGPVREACLLAGLPIPRNSSDPSLGSVM